MAKRVYIIHTLDFKENSSGIFVMHKLCHLLRLAGYESYLDCKGLNNKGWKTPTLFDKKEKLRQLILDGAIAIYPEAVNNILYSKAPVGWILSPCEAVLDKNYSFEAAFNKGTPILNVYAYDDSLFNLKGSYKRKGCAVYVGKGSVITEAGDDMIKKHRTIVEITRAYPSKRKDLARILKSINVLFTADPLTALTTEARMCGTPVVYVGPEMSQACKDAPLKPGYAFNTTPEEIRRALNTISDYPQAHEIYRSYEEPTVMNFIKDTQTYWINGTKEHR